MALSSATLEVICDAGPLIHLDEIGQLALLADFQAIFVPDPVWQEVSQHRSAVFQQDDVHLIRASVPVSGDVRLQSLVQTLMLGRGEQAALALMSVYPHAIFLTDDAAARLAGQSLGYRVHGSIGILLRAVRRNQRSQTEVVEILRTLPGRSTLYIRHSLLAEIIAQLQG